MTAPSPLEHTVILASAGTGKTYQLTNRYIALLHGGAQPEEILATTFTRKAAGEILDRVMRRLADAALDEEKYSQLAGDISAADLTQKQCLAMLVSLARRLHRVNVCTLDSFFMRLARVFCLELGITPGWEILDELADHRLRIDAVASMLQRRDAGALAGLMRLINDGEYRRPVFEQIMSVVTNLYSVYLTSPDAQWGGIQVPPGLAQPQVAKAVDMLATLPLPANASGKPNATWKKANDKAAACAGSADWLGMLGQGIAKNLLAGKDKFSSKDIPAAVREVYQPLIAHAGSVLVARLVRRTQAVRSLIGDFAREYDAAKASRRAFTFDDITRTLARAAAGQEATDLPDIFARLDSTIGHVLLDEFQDTSLSQWNVVRPIAEASLNSPPGPDGSFFAVGDVKQAIYGWRGGQSQLLAGLSKTYKRLSARRLVRNYRSAPAVIEMVNTVFTDIVNNPALQNHREAAAAWAKGFSPHETARTELVGYAQLRTAPAAGADEDSDAVLLRCGARQVKEIIDRAPACSVGILFRRRKHIPRLIYELRRPGIDIRASQESGNPLTDSPAVSAAMSLLVLADHPGHTAAAFHVASSPLGKAVGLAPGSSASAIRSVARKVRRRLQSDGYAHTLTGWLDTVAEDCDRRDVYRFEQLIELAMDFDRTAKIRAGEFVQLVRRRHVEDPATSRVRVMTLHQAKGLQFDVVVLPELDVSLAGAPGLKALASSDDPLEPPQKICLSVNETVRQFSDELETMHRLHLDAAISESLSVLYVALTRAVYATYMIIKPTSKNQRGPTFSSVLRGALTGEDAIAPDSVAAEFGQADWYTHLPAAPAETPAQATPTKQRKLLAPSKAERMRNLERQSPSALEGGDKVRLDRRLRLEEAAAMTRGSIIHGWFELIEWLDEPAPSDEALRVAAAPFGATEEVLDEYLAAFRKMCDKAAVRAAMSRSAYQDKQASDIEVLREHCFAERLGDTIMTGSVDRLVIGRSGGEATFADIIDFKTDAVDPGDRASLEELVRFYSPQMEAYRLIVSRQTRLPIERVATSLLFVGPPDGIVIQL